MVFFILSIFTQINPYSIEMTYNLVLKICSSKYFLWPFILASLIVISAIIYYSNIEDEFIFPNSQSYQIQGYTDVLDGGNSEILEQSASDSALIYRFQLKEGFVSPYAGIKFTSSSENLINLSQYNQLCLTVKSDNLKRIGVAIYSPLDEEKKLDESDESLFHSYLSIGNRMNTFQIPFSELKNPEWWADMHQMTNTSDVPLDLNQILHVNISTAYSPDISENKLLIIHSLYFSRGNTPLFAILIIGYLGVVLLLFSSIYWLKYRNKDSSSLTVIYKPVEIKDEEMSWDQNCIEYINQYFYLSELNLDLVAKETGVHQRKITNLISKKFNCNFKTYINRIRIQEAQRLLTKSDLNIGEIAYKVGFNSQSHFNRVFKAEEQINPSEYRDNQL